MSSKIIFNGKEYNSIDEMPEADAKLYQQTMGMFADNNNNGMPDFIESMTAENMFSMAAPVQIVWDGKVYTSVDQLPTEGRAKYDEAMKNASEDTQAASASAQVVWTGGLLGGATTQILHGGKLVTNPDDLPPDARAKYQKAMQLFADENKNGIPDIMEGMTTGAVQNIQFASMARTPGLMVKSSSEGKMLLLLAALALLLMVAVVVLVGVFVLLPQLRR